MHRSSFDGRALDARVLDARSTAAEPAGASCEAASARVDEPPAEAVAELYSELHRCARHVLAGHGPLSLNATALVNEVYLRLRQRYEWRGRSAFIALAVRAMRSILVDRARARAARPEAAGESSDVDLDAVVDHFEQRCHGLIELDAALEKLAQRDPALVRLVELRFFGGRGMDEVAELLGISPRQATRWWTTARAFLRMEIDGG